MSSLPFDNNPCVSYHVSFLSWMLVIYNHLVLNYQSQRVAIQSQHLEFNLTPGQDAAPATGPLCLKQTLSFLSVESRMPNPFHSCVHAGPFPKNFFSVLLLVYPNATNLTQLSSGVPCKGLPHATLDMQTDFPCFREKVQIPPSSHPEALRSNCDFTTYWLTDLEKFT